MFSHHQRAKVIYDYFQEHYKLGVVGLWHLYGVSATCLKGERNFLSSLIIAPAGSLKSSIIFKMQKIAPSKVYLLQNQLTDRSIEREYNTNKNKMNGRLWYIEDAVTCFPSLEDQRQVRLINVFVTMLSDGHYSYADFNATREMIGKIGLYVNVADNNFKMIYSILQNTTFLDRTLPFRYTIDPEDEKEVIDYLRHQEVPNPPKISFISGKVSFNKELDYELNKLVYLISERSGLSRIRTSSHIGLVLKSIALFEGRNVVTLEDINFLKKMFMIHLTISEVEHPLVMAFVTLLKHNRHAELTESFEFFKTDGFKIEFPNHNKINIENMKIDVLKLYYSRALKMISQEEEIHNLLENIKSRNTKPGDVTHVI